jgi:hypothetical protein
MRRPGAAVRGLLMFDRSWVTRRPVMAAVGCWLLMLVATGPVLGMRGDARTVWWASALALLASVYAVGASWFLRTRVVPVAPAAPVGKPPAAGVTVAFALAFTPWLVAYALVLLGAAPWTLWTALAVAGALLGRSARRLRGDHPAGRDSRDG